jgi:hypothetical protein
MSWSGPVEEFEWIGSVVALSYRAPEPRSVPIAPRLPVRGPGPPAPVACVIPRARAFDSSINSPDFPFDLTTDCSPWHQCGSATFSVEPSRPLPDAATLFFPGVPQVQEDPDLEGGSQIPLSSKDPDWYRWSSNAKDAEANALLISSPDF